MAKPHSLFRLALVPFGLLLITILSLNTMVSAAPQSVNWSENVNRSNSNPKSVYGSVAYDARGFIHIVWLEYNSDPAQSSRVMYTNNINGNYIAPYEVSGGGGKNNSHMVAITVESNRVHVFYTAEDKGMRHRLVTLNGATPTRGEVTTLSEDAKGYAPTATVDNRGRVHAAWIDNRSDRYQVYHRIWSNGRWESVTRAVRRNGNHQDFPSLAATTDGRVHITFKNTGEPLAYSWFDDSWHSGGSPASGEANISSLASDGTNLYVVWSTRGHEITYAEGRNGNWPIKREISRNLWSDYPTIAYSPGNRRVYAAWGEENSPNTKIVVREIAPGGTFNDIVTIGVQDPSSWPRAAAGSTGISVVWQDKSDGAEEIRHSIARVASTPTPTSTPSPTATPSPTPTPPPPAGSLDALDACKTTWQTDVEIDQFANQATVDVKLSNTNHGASAATQYSLADDREAGDPTTPFTGPSQTVQFPLNVSDNLCRPHTIYGKVKNQWGTSSSFRDTIIYDPAVSAEIHMRNPNLQTDIPQDGTAALPNISPLNAGDPAYTNLNLYYLSLRARSDECSGLDNYTIAYTSVPQGSTIPEPATEVLEVNGGPLSRRLPDTRQGEYRFQITLRDNAGNERLFPNSGAYSMTYDSSPPTVAATQLMTPTTVVSGVVSVDLSDVEVTDNLYPGAGSGQQYWGTWILVKRASAGQPSETEWMARGVVVPGTAESLRWNVAMGLVDPFVPGNYRMYIRFIDGAANVGSRVLVTPPFAVDELTGPRVYLPTVLTP